MANQLNVSPAAILAASTEFADVADTARRIRQDLEDRLKGLSPIAGDDEMGHVFAARFGPAADATTLVLEGVSDGMTKTTEDLQNTAGLYTKANNVNTDLGRHLV